MRSEKTTSGNGKDMPPKLQHVKIYFDQKRQPVEAAEAFFKHYKSCKWKTKTGCSIKDWKAAAANWIWQHRSEKPLSIEIKLKLQFQNSF